MGALHNVEVHLTVCRTVRSVDGGHGSTLNEHISEWCPLTLLLF